MTSTRLLMPSEPLRQGDISVKELQALQAAALRSRPLLYLVHPCTVFDTLNSSAGGLNRVLTEEGETSKTVLIPAPQYHGVFTAVADHVRSIDSFRNSVHHWDWVTESDAEHTPLTATITGGYIERCIGALVSTLVSKSGRNNSVRINLPSDAIYTLRGSDHAYQLGWLIEQLMTIESNTKKSLLAALVGFSDSRTVLTGPSYGEFPIERILTAIKTLDLFQNGEHIGSINASKEPDVPEAEVINEINDTFESGSLIRWVKVGRELPEPEKTVAIHFTHTTGSVRFKPQLDAQVLEAALDAAGKHLL